MRARVRSIAALSFAGALGCAAGGEPRPAPPPVSTVEIARPPARAPASSDVDAGEPEDAAGDAGAPRSRFDTVGVVHDAPSIVTHPRIQAARGPIDRTRFVAAGCGMGAHGGPSPDCNVAPFTKRFGCRYAPLSPPERTAGLTPAATFVECLQPHDPAQSPSDVVTVGCMLPAIRAYVADVGGTLRTLRTRRDLAQAFAPIDSPAEALAFALAATNLDAVWELPPGARFYAPRVETTTAEPAPGGFRVHLFSEGACGCGPHVHDAVDVTVARDGEVKIGPATHAYARPEDDGLCVD